MNETSVSARAVSIAIARDRAGPCEELRQIFAAKGFEGQTLDRVVETIARDHNFWAETVVREEFGLEAGNSEKPVRAGAATFAAFLAAGVIPLAPFLLPWIGPAQAFVASIAATSVAFLGIGLLRSDAVRAKDALDQDPAQAPYAGLPSRMRSSQPFSSGAG